MAAEIALLGPKLRLRDIPAVRLWALEREVSDGWKEIGGFASRKLLSQIAESYGLDDNGKAVLRCLPKFYRENCLP